MRASRTRQEESKKLGGHVDGRLGVCCGRSELECDVVSNCGTWRAESNRYYLGQCRVVALAESLVSFGQLLVTVYQNDRLIRPLRNAGSRLKQPIGKTLLTSRQRRMALTITGVDRQQTQ